MLPLPTDNLYKFMALAGLFVLGFSLYYPYKQIYELRKEQIQLLSDMKVFEMQLEACEACPPLEMKTKHQQLDSRVKLETLAIEQVKDYTLLGGIGIATGGLMVMLGFGLWYRRVQKYQDLALARDAKPTKPKPVETSPPQDKSNNVQQ